MVFTKSGIVSLNFIINHNVLFNLWLVFVIAFSNFSKFNKDFNTALTWAFTWEPTSIDYAANGSSVVRLILQPTANKQKSVHAKEKKAK